MSATTEKLALVNNALLSLGEDELSDLSDASSNKLEKLSARQMNTWLEEVLLALPWKAIAKEASLSTSATKTDSAFTYAFDMPTDYVRMIGEPTFFNGYSVDRQRSDRKSSYNIRYLSSGLIFETDHTSPQIIYVYKNFTNESWFTALPAMFKAVVVAKIAAELSYIVKDSESAIRIFESRYQLRMREASAYNHDLGMSKRERTGYINQNRTF
jgi:hypothetical protein